MISSLRMSRFFVAGTSTFSPSTPTVHLQHRLLHNGAPGLTQPIIFLCQLPLYIFRSSRCMYFPFFLFYAKYPSLQGTRNCSPASQVWFTSQFRSVICIWLGFGSVPLSNWLWRKQRQDGRLDPSPSLLSALPAQCLRSKCCWRTQRLGREEQLRCQHKSLQLFWNIYISTFPHIFFCSSKYKLNHSWILPFVREGNMSSILMCIYVVFTHQQRPYKRHTSDWVT